MYTQHVLPDELLQLWNCDLGVLEHCVSADGDPAALRPGLVERFALWLVTHLLTIDSHPTLSRIFTFRGCVDRMVTMCLLGFVEKVFVLKKDKATGREQETSESNSCILQQSSSNSGSETSIPHAATHRGS